MGSIEPMEEGMAKEATTRQIRKASGEASDSANGQA